MGIMNFDGGTELVIRNHTVNSILIEGDKGRIFVNRGKVYKRLPIQFDGRKAHWANFLHCVREQVEPIPDVHSHMLGLNLCHLAGICGRLGRELKWDSTSETIVGDDQANSMLARPYREGYEIEVPAPIS